MDMLEDITSLTVESVKDDIGFIHSNEKLVGENSLGNDDTLNRGLKQFIDIVVPKVQKLSKTFVERTKYETISQERVDELMGVSQNTCPIP